MREKRVTGELSHHIELPLHSTLFHLAPSEQKDPDPKPIVSYIGRVFGLAGSRGIEYSIH